MNLAVSINSPCRYNFRWFAVLIVFCFIIFFRRAQPLSFLIAMRQGTQQPSPDTAVHARPCTLAHQSAMNYTEPCVCAGLGL